MKPYSTRFEAAAITRRSFVRSCALSSLALASAPILSARETLAGEAPRGTGAAPRIHYLDGGWLFGGKYAPGAEAPEFDDASYARVTLPHAVARQSWQNWNPADWQEVWSYRRHFA